MMPSKQATYRQTTAAVHNLKLELMPCDDDVDAASMLRATWRDLTPEDKLLGWACESALSPGL